jgi:hypothetical protein
MIEMDNNLLWTIVYIHVYIAFGSVVFLFMVLSGVETTLLNRLYKHDDLPVYICFLVIFLYMNLSIILIVDYFYTKRLRKKEAFMKELENNLHLRRKYIISTIVR